MSQLQDIEFQLPLQIKLFQEELLRKQLAYLQSHSRYYQRMFTEHQIDVSTIRTLEDLQRIPFTEKKIYSSITVIFCAFPKRKL